MFVSWPVPKCKGSDAATQGNGIWDPPFNGGAPHGGPQRIRAFIYDVYFGLYKHETCLLQSS
jgi:hypothetical protein